MHLNHAGKNSHYDAGYFEQKDRLSKKLWFYTMHKTDIF